MFNVELMDIVKMDSFVMIITNVLNVPALKQEFVKIMKLVLIKFVSVIMTNVNKQELD